MKKNAKMHRRVAQTQGEGLLIILSTFYSTKHGLVNEKEFEETAIHGLLECHDVWHPRKLTLSLENAVRFPLLSTAVQALRLSVSSTSKYFTCNLKQTSPENAKQMKNPLHSAITEKCRKRNSIMLSREIFQPVKSRSMAYKHDSSRPKLRYDGENTVVF